MYVECHIRGSVPSLSPLCESMRPFVDVWTVECTIVNSVIIKSLCDTYLDLRWTLHNSKHEAPSPPEAKLLSCTSRWDPQHHSTGTKAKQSGIMKFSWKISKVWDDVDLQRKSHWTKSYLLWYNPYFSPWNDDMRVETLRCWVDEW